MMKRTWKWMTVALASAALVLSLAGSASAQEDAPDCTGDDDCPSGMFCAIPPCAPPCDPDDESCDMSGADCPTEGYCADYGGGWDSECETDADCSDGYVCEAIGAMSVGCACPDGPDGEA